MGLMRWLNRKMKMSPGAQKADEGRIEGGRAAAHPSAPDSTGATGHETNPGAGAAAEDLPQPSGAAPGQDGQGAAGGSAPQPGGPAGTALPSAQADNAGEAPGQAPQPGGSAQAGGQAPQPGGAGHAGGQAPQPGGAGHAGGQALQPRTSPAAKHVPAPDSAALSLRLDWFHKRLERCSDITFHSFTAGNGQRCAAVFLQGMTDQKLFQEQLMGPILRPDFVRPGERLIDKLADTHELPVSDFSAVNGEEKALEELFAGNILLLLDGEARMLVFPMTSTQKRSITESQNEPVIRGPREAFVEDIATNLSLIRRRVKHPDCKTEEFTFGSYTQTKVILAYIEGLAGEDLIQEIRARLSRIRTDSLTSSSMIEEFIEDNPRSPFPQLLYTERPDTAASAILEGRAVIIVDGTPIVILAPVTLVMFLQSAEDYYQRFVSATWIRWIRFAFVFISLLFPSFYIAVTTFHPEALPSSLLITVASAREVVPFPALIEALIMEVTFEGLREATVRTPKNIGQAISILGALVIGQAAVQAGIVSAPMVIIVSITGIASFVIPHFDLGLPMRLLRFPLMLMAGSFGLFGIAISLILISIHLLSLRSFGTAYMAPIAPLQPESLKDTVVRAPWWRMKKRADYVGVHSVDRMESVGRPRLPGQEEED